MRSHSLCEFKVPLIHIGNGLYASRIIGEEEQCLHRRQERVYRYDIKTAAVYYRQYIIKYRAAGLGNVIHEYLGIVYPKLSEFSQSVLGLHRIKRSGGNSRNHIPQLLLYNNSEKYPPPQKDL